jgi:hypothetical protein
MTGFDSAAEILQMPDKGIRKSLCATPQDRPTFCVPRSYHGQANSS